MSDQDNSVFEFNTPKDKLLSTNERLTCQLISIGDPPWSQRAQVLLAIDDGANEEDASMRSGLAPTQVAYWMRRFETERMDIFPEEVVFPSPSQSIPDESPSSVQPPALKGERIPETPAAVEYETVTEVTEVVVEGTPEEVGVETQQKKDKKKDKGKKKDKKDKKKEKGKKKDKKKSKDKKKKK